MNKMEKSNTAIKDTICVGKTLYSLLAALDINLSEFVSLMQDNEELHLTFTRSVNHGLSHFDTIALANLPNPRPDFNAVLYCRARDDFIDSLVEVNNYIDDVGINMDSDTVYTAKKSKIPRKS